MTVKVSAGSPHAVVTGALLTSPLYSARHRYTPAALGVNDGDAYEPLPLTVTGDETKAGAALQEVSFGPKALKTIDFVGLLPEMVAVSEAEFPRTTWAADACVLNVGWGGGATATPSGSAKVVLDPAMVVAGATLPFAPEANSRTAAPMLDLLSVT
jgi:hypothetical protein